MAPTLSDYEYMFGEDGVLLNASDAGHAASLPFIDVQKVEGLDSAPIRVTNRDHEGVDGGFVDAEFMQTRHITVEGILYADPDDPDEICDQLRVDFGPGQGTKPFYWKHPSKTTRVVYGKGLGARYDINALRRLGQSELQLQISCPDPYIYDADTINTTGRIVSQGSGFGFDLGFDFGFGASIGDSGGVTVFNNGNHEAYPIITIFGPVSQPTLSESHTGKMLTFDITLGTDDFLVIDFRKRSIKLNGIASRRDAFVPGSTWWTIPPRKAITITFTGSIGAASGTATAVGETLLVSEDFEDDTLNFTVTHAGNTPAWARNTTDPAHGGTGSFKSGAITHNQTTDAVVTVPAGATKVQFWYKVSSETDFDKFRFLVGSSEEFATSGEVDWTQSTLFDIPDGATTVTFRYTKDVDTSTGSDAAWIDDVEFFEPQKSDTPDYLIATEADASDIAVDDRAYLYTSQQALKEPTLFTVTSKQSDAGFTNIFFTPNAVVVPQAGDILSAGIPYFALEMQSTWY